MRLTKASARCWEVDTGIRWSMRSLLGSSFALPERCSSESAAFIAAKIVALWLGELAGGVLAEIVNIPARITDLRQRGERQKCRYRFDLRVMGY